MEDLLDLVLTPIAELIAALRGDDGGDWRLWVVVVTAASLGGTAGLYLWLT